MNNSVYVKTMENLRKRAKIRLVNNVKDYKIYVSKPSFVSQKIFSKKFVAIHEIKPVLTLDKPIYVSILDLRKLLMYEFHYKYIQLKYENCANLLITNRQFMKFKQAMFMKTFTEAKICLILVTIQKTQNYLILSIKNYW